jgi:hypothetical protein
MNIFTANPTPTPAIKEDIRSENVDFPPDDPEELVDGVDSRLMGTALFFDILAKFRCIILRIEPPVLP